MRFTSGLRNTHALPSTDEERRSDPAFAPVDEAGGGTSEGFEQAELDLIDRISDPDRVGAHPHRHEHVESAEGRFQALAGEADSEHSSARPEDDR